MQTQEIPTIAVTLVVVDGVRIVRFWCRYCRQYHAHGHPSAGPIVGHRRAHCFNPDSPYRATGYELVVAAGVTGARLAEREGGRPARRVVD